MKSIVFALFLLCALGISSVFGQALTASPATSSAAEYDTNIPVFNGSMDVSLVPSESTNRRVVIVPSNEFPTIQSAIGSAETILVRPGVYHENIHINGTTTIRALFPRSEMFPWLATVIDGGTTGNTISLNTYSRVTLQDLYIINVQPRSYYSTAAVFGWGGVAFSIKNCSIKSASIGLSSSYAFFTNVKDTTFIGGGADTVGAMISLQDFLGDNFGARIENSSFRNLTTGVHHYELGNSPSESYLKLRRNTYRDVVQNLFYTHTE